MSKAPKDAELTFTEVATNAIWRETVRREQAQAKLRTNFSVPNPNKGARPSLLWHRGRHRAARC